MSKKTIPPIVEKIQKYIPVEMDHSYQKSISYSQISTYVQCPLKWSLQYRDGHYKFESTINTTFGTAIHNSMEIFLDTLYNKSGVEADDMDLVGTFEEEFKKEYLIQFNKNKEIHFSSPDEMREFFEDGKEILTFIQKKRREYFGGKGWYLVGSEIPILINPNLQRKNLIFKGFIDLVLYNDETKTFRIIDFKSSSRGWSNKEKKDEQKQYQLILYKHYFHKQFNIPLDNIEVEFIILKRKLWDESQFAQSRVQLYSPASGKIKLSKANKVVESFIHDCFTADGQYKADVFKAKDNKNCKYCSFNKTNLCTK